MTDLSPYVLPDGNVAIAFSGGRSSAYMLHQILEANGSLPERVVVTFQNTGREMPETLDFVQECADRWGVRIVWLEWRDPKNHGTRWEVVSHNSASRNGEPFMALIRKRQMLPNRVARFCTAELKVHTCTRYCRSLGWDRWTVARGLRADEPGRLNGAPPKERWTPWHPMADGGVGKHDVAAFWSKQPFDLRLANINGKTPHGNCDGCFLKSEANLAALARDYPERAQWWAEAEAEAEAKYTFGKGTAKWFNHRRPVADLIDMVDRMGPGLFDDEAYLCQADGGECF